jgi:hypothetical protein
MGMARAIIGLLLDLPRFGALFFRSSASIRAENLVLRKQIASFVERGIKPRRVDHAARVSLTLFTIRANSICERVIGTIRRECLAWISSMSEKHLRAILAEWVTYDNRARVHKALGPGVPDPPKDNVPMARSESRHRLAAGTCVLAKLVLCGLHHEYSVAAARSST